MGSEPPLILAFDTSAARCAAALVSGRPGARGARRGDGPRPGRAAAADARGAAGGGRPRLGGARRPRRLHRPWQLHRAPDRRGRGARAGAGARRAGGRGDGASRRWPARPGRSTVAIEDRKGTVLRPGVPRRRRRSGRTRSPGDELARRARGGRRAARRLRGARRGSRRGGSGPPRRRRRSTSAPPTRCRRREAPPRSSMTPEALAALHALAFTDTPRPWSAAEFAALLGEPSTVLAVAAGRSSRSGGSPGRRPSC